MKQQPTGDECKDVDAGIEEFDSLAVLQKASDGWSYQLIAILTLILPIIGVFLAGTQIWNRTWTFVDLGLFLVMYVWAVLGIELGFHRYLTHRSLKTYNWMRTFFIISGCMAAHGQPIWWCAIHRRHHQYSDHHGDPHSPNLHGAGLIGMLRGGWHSHLGWMFEPKCTAAYATHFTKDLLSDRSLLFLDRHYVTWVLLGLAIPAAIGGALSQSLYGAWTGFIWGGLLRIFCDQHALWWGIVTVCHRFGYRTFQSNDQSTNHWLIAILFLGDGWHNNHHAFPSSARVGHFWWEYDPTWSMIKVLKLFGLVWEVKVPSAESIEQKRISTPTN